MLPTYVCSGYLTGMDALCDAGHVPKNASERRKYSLLKADMRLCPAHEMHRGKSHTGKPYSECFPVFCDRTRLHVKNCGRL